MNPRNSHSRVGWSPQLGRIVVALAIALALALPATAFAQRRGKRKRSGKRAPVTKTTKTAPAKQKVFDFRGLDLAGRLRTPQLLYFLDRANEELERASLERRSFIPEMVRTMEEEAL